jgi:hypothetical protein
MNIPNLLSCWLRFKKQEDAALFTSLHRCIATPTWIPAVACVWRIPSPLGRYLRKTALASVREIPFPSSTVSSWQRLCLHIIDRTCVTTGKLSSPRSSADQAEAIMQASALGIDIVFAFASSDSDFMMFLFQNGDGLICLNWRSYSNGLWPAQQGKW